MDTASAEDAFNLLFGGDRIAGEFSWDNTNTTLTFQPDDLLRLDTTYLLNIASSAMSASGEAMLDRGYSQSFRTVPYPGVDYTSPSNT